MARLLLLMFLFANLSNVYAETFVNINDETVRMRRNTRCGHHGKKDLRTVCDCCVVKSTVIKKRTSADALTHCKESYGCQYKNEALTSDAIANEYILSARKNLKAMTIHPIEKLNKDLVLPDDGILKMDHVFSIVKTLQNAGLLQLPADIFHDQDNLKIKPLGDSSKGFYTGQLFAIQYDAHFLDPLTYAKGSFKPLFILKETKKAVREIKHLYSVATSKLASEKVTTFAKMVDQQKPSSSTIAQIAFDEVHFKLKTSGKSRYFSLLQTAPGKSLNQHLKEFGKVAKTKALDDEQFIAALKKMKHVFYRVGYAMSELHQKYAQRQGKKKYATMKTYTHGDLHSENIFYDEETDAITLIDNETFALSLSRPSSGVNDIVEFYMLHTIHTLAHRVSSQLTTNIEFGIDDQLWHELWRALFDGYFFAYGDLSKADFENLYKGFRTEFLEGFSQLKIFKSFRNFKDQRKLKRFGPSLRRCQFKNHDLVRVFDRFHEDEIRKYAGSREKD